MQQGASLKTSVIYAFIRPLVDNHYCCIVSDGSKVKSNFEVSLHSSHDNLKESIQKAVIPIDLCSVKGQNLLRIPTL